MITFNELAETIKNELVCAPIGGKIVSASIINNEVIFRFYNGQVFSVGIKKLDDLPKIPPNE